MIKHTVDTIRQRIGPLSPLNCDTPVGSVDLIVHDNNCLCVKVSATGDYCFFMETEKTAKDLTILLNMGISMRIKQ